MDLWIRSQSKECLINANYICIRDDVKIVTYGNSLNLENYVLLGKYKTKERALKVLDEIQNALNTTVIKQTSNSLSINSKEIVVYEMPEK